MIVVIDNFVKDEMLLKDIAADQTFFADPGVYYYWGGWWDSSANTIKKRLIEYIWGHNCPINESFNINGFEYWTGIQTANPEKGFKNILGNHYDKDEAWFEKTGAIVIPLIGTVYYPAGQEFEGGELAIYTDGVNSPPEIVKAKPNRLIIFGAGNYVHEVKPVTSGTRHAIAINLWENEPYSKQVGQFRIEA
jgi:hypothetical protein